MNEKRIEIVTGASAIVLAGGVGTRMGRDKTAVEFRGETLLGRAVRVMLECFDEVVISVAPGGTGRAMEVLGDAAPTAGIKFAEDIFPGRGPVAGIHAGMEKGEARYYFVAGCDMPFLDAGLCVAMTEYAFEKECDVLVPELRNGYRHPLHAVYSRNCLPHIRRQLETGESNRIIHFFPSVKVCTVDEECIKKYDSEMNCLMNVNDAQELERARGIES